jgi:DNA-binding protein H-NS
MEDKIDAIDKEIEGLQIKKKALLEKGKEEALTTIRASIARYGFTAQDLGLSMSKSIKAKEAAPSKVKAAAKYADPANPSKTWAGGKGARPLWVQSHLSNGGSLEDLLIK